MGMKDRLQTWFIQNYIMPKLKDYSKPGYVVVKLATSKGTLFFREICICFLVHLVF